ncbi:hypothetical protein ACFQMF_15740 [Halorubrum rutilum]|uniref:EF-hand domain-containing protein n=1 Tax=Halorubrum rutilum TaxID=1364933 RepID=A0ABD6ANV6_9EURY|nr:hypothetical protein [Halorubrum rutilum]
MWLLTLIIAIGAVSVVVSTTAAQSGSQFEIEYSGSGTDGPSPFSQDLSVQTVDGETFELGPESEYTVRVVKPATGEQVTLPLQNATQTYTVSDLSVNPGNLIEGQTQMTVSGPETTAFPDVSVQGDLGMFESETFAAYEVQIVDQNGNPVATTEPRTRGVLYEVDIEYNGSTIAISRDPEVNPDWYVELEQNVSGSAANEKILEFRNQGGTDYFVASVENTEFNESRTFGIGIYKDEPGPDEFAPDDLVISPFLLEITDEQRVSGPVGNQSQPGSPLSGSAGEFDDDGDGTITASELGNAVNSYGQGELTASELGDVVTVFGQS